MSNYNQNRNAAAQPDGLVLQKQLPSSQLPRFNPHGEQAPPKPKKSEFVSNAYSPSKNKSSKLATHHEEEGKGEYQNMEIGDLLQAAGAEYRNPDKIPGGWLPLEAFDDQSFDTRLPANWLRKKGVGNIPTDGVGAHGLWQDKDKLCYWRKIRLTKYLPKSQRFEGQWEVTKQKCRLARIFIIFDEEDPKKFVERFKRAYQNRIYADALIKYGYYVENMPKHQIPEIDNYQVNRVLAMTQNTKALRGKSSADTTNLLNEVNNDFAKTMNNIIFDKHLNEKGTNLITGQLHLPPKAEKKATPHLGMINTPVPKDSFAKTFSKFTFKTLQAKDEVICAQQEIRKECNEVAERDIYNPNINNTMSVDDFNQIQASSISQAAYYLKETWVTKIKEIIKVNHDKSLDGQRSWFNLAETNREAYEIGKLRRFLIQQRFLMEDTILQLTRRSVKNYVNSVNWFLPISTTIHGTGKVKNVYYSEQEIRTIGAKKKKFPLFQIDLVLNEDNEVVYSHEPDDVVLTILKTFENGLLALQEIPQLEQKLMPHLFKSNMKMELKVPTKPATMPEAPAPEDKKKLPDENTWVYKEYQRLQSKIYECIEPLEQYIETFKVYRDEYKLDPRKEIAILGDEDTQPEPSELRKMVIEHTQQAQKLRSEIKDFTIVSMFRVNCRGIREVIAEKHTFIAEEIKLLIAKKAKKVANETMEAFDKLNLAIETAPKDIEDLSEIKEKMQNAPNEIAKLKNEIASGLKVYQILKGFQFKFGDEEDLNRQYRLFAAPGDTLEKISKQGNYLDKEKDKFVNIMQQDQVEFNTKIDELQNEVIAFDQYVEFRGYEEVAVKARALMDKMNAAQNQAKQYNKNEDMTGLEQTSYENIKESYNLFLPYYELWTQIDLWESNMKSWLNDDFLTINPTNLEEAVGEAQRIINKNIKIFRNKNLTKILKVAEHIKEKIDAFTPSVRMLCAMLTEGMKDRHWTAISDACGMEVKPYEGFTVKNIQSMGLIKFTDQIETIGDRAGKEFNIEKSLETMERAWEDVFFTLKPFKKSGTCTVLGFDDAGALLDEHIVLTQTMQFSSFKGPFVEQLEAWNAALINMQDVCEEWLRCQRDWAYLQPIFDSNDITKQLPAESKKFKTVDKKWVEIIKGMESNPNVLASCSRVLKDGSGLLETFRMCNANLEKVQRGLKDYLEEKCAVFARFYFLAADDLLEILSQTKEVMNVRPHLKKVFENMNDMEFLADTTIVAMMSGENEKVQFMDKVDPRDKKVEDWMCEVEKMMYMSIRMVLKNSIEDYEVTNRPDWILKHAGQCVLNGSQVHWTANLENACNAEGTKGVYKFYQKICSELLDTVALVRKPLGKLQKITLGALIVIDVHARDVIQKLIDEKIGDITQFEWISQLRYYWVGGDCRVRCIQTDFPYGYEYLGNTGRLVITALTDKCYMTLMGALKLNLGGAPAGPAGTGKTESTKDLAKALAKQCVVFNCSDGMDHLMIAKFFKGLSASGAWCCFDEFNRINVEVLSVIAQQLLELFTAKAQNLTEIEFSGSKIKMKPTFCVFITMNPGYAGRQELPDNLKALFRPVAMMVPNYAVIGEIMLYSFGYNTAQILANKMVTTFTLASEQLSSQDHYDYGMRAVRSVINAAGILKGQFPDMEEDQLLLRALKDVNVPKFLKDDLPLFENIIIDLFPTTKQPVVDRGLLLESVKKICKKMHVQSINAFIEKVFQLYDTTVVRHGLMIVGPTGGGKTTCYKVLAAAQTALAGTEEFVKTNYHILNPKSITMDQLYGSLDPASGEWNDGVAAKIIATCAKDQSLEKHWVMFDGPVDALWIESMNTVLDDNKKLCLNSGQIIPLSNQMTMMFEVEDLSVASPATVSRCGMVYMEPGSIGLQPLVDSWLQTLSEPIRLLKPKSTIMILTKLFDKYLDNCIKFMRKNCPEPVPSVNNNVCQSMLRIMDCFFQPYQNTDAKTILEAEIEDLESMLEPLFIFSCIWSIGATTTPEGRAKFSDNVRQLMGKDNEHRMPLEGSVYDYCYDKASKGWISWNDTVAEYQVDQKASYAEIIVPTFDSIRMKYVKRLLITNGKHVLCPGPTGTGKTINFTDLLSKEMPEEYTLIPITFSAQTSANQTQDGLDEKFEKRRKGVFGPPTGKKFVIFIDDLNMPKREVYFAQPPIELIRQWLDHKGWYNRDSKEKEFKKIEDIILVSAMGPPGGGRSPVTGRLQRHYNFLTYTDLDSQSVSMIFVKILNRFFTGFEAEVIGLINKLVEATKTVYSGVQTKLKPTPNKSHYTFNLRDISKIFQGACSANQKTINNKVKLLQLWYHENMRVFSDRMINEDDKDVLKALMFTETERNFQVTKDMIMDRERIIFGDYQFGNESENRPYVIVDDFAKFVKRIEDYLEDFNSGSKVPMKLVMFLDACDHVSRICRVLRQPLGNALLLGVGGSGRQSLSKLATYISNFRIYQIEVIKGYSMRDWRENAKTCLMMAGVEGKPTSFLFVDTQIINEQMLEDVNNVLNSGDVPGLYRAEDLEPIYAIGKTECARKNLPVNKMNMFQCYLSRVKQNIHMIIAMSPLGEVFRTRLRKFPSLVNCCTIDWFTNWPAEALINVAKGFVSDGEMALDKDEPAAIEMFKIIHQSVEVKVDEFREVYRRISYVTPTSYLELLSMYKKVLGEQRKMNNTARMRLVRGLEVLKEAEIEIDKMNRQLEKDQPILEATQIEVEEKKKDIGEKTIIAEEKKIIVAGEEAIASKKEAEVKAVKDDADDKLGVALPALEIAIAKVKKIQVKDFYELKNINIPKPSIVTCFKLVCLFLRPGVKPKVPNDPGKKEIDPEGYFFDITKNDLLSNPNKLLKDLIEYDKDNIPEATVQKVKPLMMLPEMETEKISNVSQALAPVGIWITAMLKYHDTLKIVNPLREIAREKGEQLAVVQSELAKKRAEVKAIMDGLAALQKEQKELTEKAEKLTADLETCKKKMVRANKMIEGLAGEKDRWQSTVKRLTDEQDFIVGNSLIAAGMICYAGPFITQFREAMEELWRNKMKELYMQITEKISMKQVLGNDVVIRQWAVAGLPSDNLSIENGIIMFGSRRWPLMIDPQTQANKFIKKMGSQTQGVNLDVFKLSEGNLIRSLELAIQFGKWVLLENIGEYIDPALEPILLQQKVKVGQNWTIKIGERSIPYNDSFKFFLTTTLPNPHYSPETSVKVTILNFSITPVGLEEQMLNLLILLEMPELQEKKNAIVGDNARSAEILYKIEDNLLAALSGNTVDELLSTDDLINTLADSQKTSAEIAVRQAESKVTEKEIDVKREGFREVAYRAQLLFFCIVDLNIINDMYQYSLQWFQNLFKGSVINSEPSDDTINRVDILNKHFTFALYNNVCRSLFECDKLLFSFLLCTKILFGNNEIDMNEWRFFLAGPSGQIEEKPNPTQWLDNLEWIQSYKQLYTMDKNIPCFEGIEEYFINFNVKFKKIFDSVDAQDEPMPGDWNTKLNSFQKMILLKCIRPDKITAAIQNFIVEKMGQKFIEPPTFNLQACFSDSDNCTPLIFILSPGSDPIGSFMSYVDQSGMMSRFKTISLGSGQAKPAEEMIAQGKQQGLWVLLANCHLCISWMPRLEAIVEQLVPNNHQDFRLWLTSSPSPKFPVSVLQNSVKMTLEPPSGLKQNLLETYSKLDNKQLNDCAMPVAFKKLFFAFSFFHALVQDRRKFGAIGWNIPYAFMQEDYGVCIRQLKIFLDESSDGTIPYKVLTFLSSEVNYGGRVTDDKDVRLIKSIVSRFVCPGIQDEGFALSSSGLYKTIPAGSKEDYLEYIRSLPLVPGAEAFGLHENAEITTNQSATRIILENVLAIQPRQSNTGGQTREQQIAKIASEIEAKTPAPFDIEEVQMRYPTDYNESMNTVLTQELTRYNKLLVIMDEMLKELAKALVGEVVMSEELDTMANSLFNNMVPIAWQPTVGFLSLKPLASWINDLNDRISFLSKWVSNGAPATFWISGFFFPQAFFTSTLQNYARKYKIAIDQLAFDFKVCDDASPSSITEPPEDGCFIFGMYMEGARWNNQTHFLDESIPKQLYTEFPLIWLLPKKDRKKPISGIYNCPVYKVLSRAGTLSTTGHSTNFCLMIELPCREEEDVWIRAGVALFLALRY